MKKKLVVAATAGALAVAAGQAFALENIFNGSFAIRGIHSNYAASGSAGYLLSGTSNVGPSAALTRDSERSTNFIEQRTRLFYTAKANDNLKFVTGFELDSTWGKSSYLQGRANDGGSIGADTTNIETKHAYLDFNCPITGANFKGGIMPFIDAYKGVFINADAAGILLSKGFGPATAGFGWFRLDDRDTYYGVSTADLLTGAVSSTTSNALGRQTRDLLVLDGKYNVNKDVKVGASYYYLANYGSADRANNRADQRVHTLGANAAATFGPATVDGFFLYQFGRQSTGATNLVFGESQHVESWVANLAGKVKAGPGTAKMAALWVSGGTSDDGRKSAGFVNINNQTSGSFAENTGGAAGSTMLLFRNPGTTSNDQSLVYDTSFNGNGVVGLSAGYDANISEKAFASANLGMAWSATNRNANVSGVAYNPYRAYSKYLGTEINATVGYKLFDNLTASLDAAYVFLGAFYDGKGRAKAADPTIGSDPANPYVTRLNLTYTF